ncbi:WXG100 family type VII secretion target [Nocardia farcinica]|uniref:WXG100 family type VII secretion target n=1 Tax=Nocardia farcinica TaxID=37329 RepID=UPI001894E71B|nr:WXG100 family type VII secretion target [Nocardia farcinica]MBF6254480.1 WXG100 family type VII secretion target [Nocardia farcinica]
MSGNQQYRIDLEQLDAAIDTLAKFGKTVEDWLAEVDGKIADLHLSWSSQAAAAQRDAHQKWLAGVAEMRENLDELREVARKAHANYSAAIDVNTKMWP